MEDIKVFEIFRSLSNSDKKAAVEFLRKLIAMRPKEGAA